MNLLDWLRRRPKVDRDEAPAMAEQKVKSEATLRLSRATIKRVEGLLGGPIDELRRTEDAARHGRGSP